jgi:hypothetical protein
MLGARASINVCTGANPISGSQRNDGVDDARAAFGSMKSRAFGSMKSSAKMAVVTVSRSAAYGKVHHRFVFCRDCWAQSGQAVFEGHGVDASTRVLAAKAMRRNKLQEFFASLPACLVGLQASGPLTGVRSALFRLRASRLGRSNYGD